jgi:hypothetical protein
MAVPLDLSSIEGVSALLQSPVQLVLLGAVAFVVLAFVGRVVARNLPSSQPPILEGVPFVGGLLKFAGVRKEQRCAHARRFLLLLRVAMRESRRFVTLFCCQPLVYCLMAHCTREQDISFPQFSCQ